ncbi:MAG: hypothetical protein A4E25_01161 [Methanobacterium sp. PtaB.Bin024]|nr:MAG: hypothetical protein A4E25_01161 [Methanobacterium sp. PtaB.Bin024]
MSMIRFFALTILAVLKKKGYKKFIKLIKSDYSNILRMHRLMVPSDALSPIRARSSLARA